MAVKGDAVVFQSGIDGAVGLALRGLIGAGGMDRIGADSGGKFWDDFCRIAAPEHEVARRVWPGPLRGP